MWFLATAAAKSWRRAWVTRVLIGLCIVSTRESARGLWCYGSEWSKISLGKHGYLQTYLEKKHQSTQQPWIAMAEGTDSLSTRIAAVCHPQWQNSTSLCKASSISFSKHLVYQKNLFATFSVSPFNSFVFALFFILRLGKTEVSLWFKTCVAHWKNSRKKVSTTSILRLQCSNNIFAGPIICQYCLKPSTSRIMRSYVVNFQIQPLTESCRQY